MNNLNGQFRDIEKISDDTYRIGAVITGSIQGETIIIWFYSTFQKFNKQLVCVERGQFQIKIGEHSHRIYDNKTQIEDKVFDHIHEYINEHRFYIITNAKRGY